MASGLHRGVGSGFGLEWGSGLGIFPQALKETDRFTRIIYVIYVNAEKRGYIWGAGIRVLTLLRIRVREE